ncbi:MAG: hypothetical protein A3J67_03435 [Parcubacteria group bacterium RIFCSPHIGHO2_02_FULL_48_10b]|nr:MAG: hypothetical protein A3J67_03435 [Parcubacteria group bacterium RIFCSPHIGHO2_02_FULL_48_10b]
MARFITFRGSSTTTLSPTKTMFVSLLIVLAGGAVGYFFGLPMAQNAMKSKNWPSAEGTVTVSRLSTHTGSDSTTYGADIAYDYTVEGVLYTGSKVTFGDYSSSDPSHAREVVNRYSEGKSVIVYYNPDDPKTSVLEPGANWSSFMVAGIGGLFVLVGLLGFASSLKKVIRGTDAAPPSAPPILTIQQ